MPFPENPDDVANGMDDPFDDIDDESGNPWDWIQQAENGVKLSFNQLEIIKNDDDSEALGGIWDYRDDKEGIYYDIAKSDQTRKERNRLLLEKPTNTLMLGAALPSI